jgi:hypothetical protein
VQRSSKKEGFLAHFYHQPVYVSNDLPSRLD